MLTRQEEGWGPPPPILDLKTTFLPLKIHWISVAKRPNKDDLKGLKRWYKAKQNKPPKGVDHP